MKHPTTKHIATTDSAPVLSAQERITRTPRTPPIVRIITLLLFCIVVQSCGNDGLATAPNDGEFSPRLSAYGIFQGTMSNLVASEGYLGYTLSSQLFTDFAEKQRLIKLPTGAQMTSMGDDLLNFPDNTIIVKTFYYFNDKRDTSKGKTIVETRLLVKRNGLWNAATYLWNDTQTDATLTTSGFDKNVQWIDAKGAGRVISYHVPSNRECATCHQSNGQLMPIGPKAQNLNIQITKNDVQTSQLHDFQARGFLTSTDLLRIRTLPNDKNPALSVQDRARAYLDINCAHCHSPTGFCANQDLFLEYKTPYESTGIATRKDQILAFMQSGFMPLLGSTVRDDEGIALLTNYINSLP